MTGSAGLELLLNPDFEAGQTGWRRSPGTTIFNITTTVVFSGSQAAAVGSVSNSAKAIVQDITGIVAGNTYTFTGNAYKNDPNLNLVRLRLAWYTAIDCSGSQFATSDSVDLTADAPAFVFLTTGPVAAPPGAQCVQVRAQVSPKSAAPAMAYFDLLSFTAASVSLPSPTPTATVPFSPTLTPTSLPSPTPTATAPFSPTLTPSLTPSPTLTATLTPTLPPSPTATPTMPSPPPAVGVVINEVGWSGTTAAGTDEWLELYNPTTQTISLAGWSITSASGSLNINLSGVMPPDSYFLLERTDDTTIADIPADQIYTGGLGNGGDILYLSNSVAIVDSANLNGGSWPAGSAGPNFASMERIDPNMPDADANWAGNDLIHRNGLTANGNPVNGTPKQPNSTTYPSPTPTPLPPSPTPTPTPSIPPALTGVVLNEVGWSGTGASATDEWLELYNPTTQTITLTGWSITNTGGSLNLNLSGVISPDGYFLLERTDDATISDIPADQIYAGGLSNNGDTLFLNNGAVVVDSANFDGGVWSAGSDSPNFASMERIDPNAPDADSNWADNDLIHRNGLDAAGNPINGTPKQPNSTTYPPPPLPLPPFGLVINEVAWGGTAASSSDEWIELHNPTTGTLSLDGALLTSTNGLHVDLTGTIPPGGYFLLERSDDATVSDATADLIYSGGLGNDGDSLFLSYGGLLLDGVNLDGDSWPAGTASPDFASMERVDPFAPDLPDNWITNDRRHRNGLDANGGLINGTPRQPNSSTFPLPPVISLLISELLYDGLTPSTEGDEFAEICNPTDQIADLTGYKVGDEEEAGKSEGMYFLPDGLLLSPATCLVIAKNAAAFKARFGFTPDFEVMTSGAGYVDMPEVPNLNRYRAWGSGGWALTNYRDEFLILGPDDQLVDAVAFRDGAYQLLGLDPGAQAPAPYSLQRVWPFDTDWMAADFLYDLPTPGIPTLLPQPLGAVAVPIVDGMAAYFGSFQARTTFSTGSAPPNYLLAKAREAGLHFLGLTDPGEALGPRAWSLIQVSAADATVPGEFVAMSGSTWQPEVGAVSLFGLASPTQAADPQLAALEDLYRYLSGRPEAIAQFDAAPPEDFADFHLNVEAAPQFYLLELDHTGQSTELDLTGLLQSWGQGWRVAPAFNPTLQAPDWSASLPVRTGVVASALTENDLLTAIRARRIFATSDENFVLTLRANGVWLGSELSQPGPANFEVTALDQEAEAVTLILYDRTVPLLQTTQLTPYRWQFQLDVQPGHFYWVKATQSDGDIALTAPIWIAGEAPPDMVYLNELLPDPKDRDWDGDGTPDSSDEWIELVNPSALPIGLAAWSIQDASGKSYKLPGDAVLPAHGYYVIFRRDSKISLNNGGDSLTLIRPDGSIADTMTYDDNPGDNVTICRLPDGGPWSLTCQPTLAAENALLPEKEPLELSIYDVKRVTEGAWVRVKGYVTVPPGIFGKNVMYIQDETHGIRVKLPTRHHYWFAEGDRLEVTGYLDLDQNEWEIDIRGKTSKIKSLHENRLITPLWVNSGMMKEGYEGLLVQLDVTPTQFASRHFWVDDGTGSAYVYLYSASKVKRTGLSLGAPVTIVGIAGQQTRNDPPRDGYRISPRYQSDIKLQSQTTLASSDVITGLIISEIAWAGTAASSNDEWLELYNTTATRLTLDGLTITSTAGLHITLKGVIEPGGFFLLERTDDTTVSSLPADQLYTGSLRNDGSGLFLSNGRQILDSINADGGSWPAGSPSPDYQTMERLNPYAPGSDSNWRSNDMVHRQGFDAGGNPLNGTPGTAPADFLNGSFIGDWPVLLPETGNK